MSIFPMNNRSQARPRMYQQPQQRRQPQQPQARQQYHDPSVNFEPLTDDLLSLINKSRPEQNTIVSPPAKAENRRGGHDLLRELILSERNGAGFFSELAGLGGEHEAFLRAEQEGHKQNEQRMRELYSERTGEEFKDEGEYATSRVADVSNGLYTAVFEEAETLAKMSEFYEKDGISNSERNLLSAMMYKKLGSMAKMNAMLIMKERG